MPIGLHGKVAIVTGGNSGIGEATVLRFAREGAKVAIVARREPEGLAVQQAVRDAGGDATFIRCDVTERADIEAAVARTVALYGNAVHVLVNNAGGGGGGAPDPFPEPGGDEAWDYTLRLNLTSTYQMTRAAWPYLKNSGGASIVNVSSLAAVAAYSPAMWDLLQSDEEALFAVAEALHEEYKTIVDAALIVQVDDAILTNLYDQVRAEGKDYRSWVAMSIEALNHGLRGIPEDRVRYHLCWGSWPGPHTSDVPLQEIVDLLLTINAQAYSIEAANPRHEWEWVVWQETKLPEGKILLPGVVSHAISHIEHPELIAQRITRFARLVGSENVIASTDCGFAQNSRIARQHPTIMWAKLESLAEGARIASAARETVRV